MAKEKAQRKGETLGGSVAHYVPVPAILPAMPSDTTGRAANSATASVANNVSGGPAAKPRKPKAVSKKPKRKQRPPRAVRLSQAERRMRPQYNARTTSRPDRIGVSVTINLPRVPGIRRRKLPPKLARVVLRMVAVWQRIIRPLPGRLRRPLALVVVLALVFVGLFSLQSSRHKADVGSGKVAAAADRTAPDFKPLLPSAAEASSQTYDGKRNLVAYDTSFSGARLTVSQQPLPARFAHDANSLQAAADSLAAKQRLDTAKGPLYIATNERGDQLAIYAAPQVLVFIHSDRKLDDASWKAFVELLQIKS